MNAYIPDHKYWGDCKDPAEVITILGPEAFRKSIENKKHILEWRLEKVSRDDKDSIKSFLESLKRYSWDYHIVYIDALSKKINVNSKVIIEIMRII